jgi:hypothetical protein
MKNEKTSIQKFGDICIINLERKQKGAEMYLENILEACKESIEILLEHKELRGYLDKDVVDLVQRIIDRNEIFYKKNDDEMKNFCFNIVALRDLKDILIDSKILEKTESKELKEGLNAIIFTIDQTIKVIDRGTFFTSVGLTIYKNIKYISVKVTKKDDAMAQDALKKVKKLIFFFLVYAVDTNRIAINKETDRQWVENFIEGLELTSSLDLSILPEDIRKMNNLLQAALKTDFSDIYRHGEIILPTESEKLKHIIKATKELSERASFCGQLCLLSPILRELEKFVSKID